MKNAWGTFLKNKIVRVWTVIFVLAAIAAGCHDDGGMLDPTGPEKVREPLNKDSQKEIDRKIWEIFDSTGVVIYYEFDDEPYILHESYGKYRSDTTVSVDAWYSLEKDGIEMWDDSVLIQGRAFKIDTTEENVSTSTGRFYKVVTEVSVEGDSVHLLELVIVNNTNGFIIEPWDNDSGAMAQIGMLEENGMFKLMNGNGKPHTIFLGKRLMQSSTERSYYITDFSIMFGGVMDEKAKPKAMLDIKVSILNGYETPRFDAINFPTSNYPQGDNGVVPSKYLGQLGERKKCYLEMILTTSFEALCGEYDYKGYNGMFNKEKYDKNGWVRKGYDALMEDFKEEHGIDLSELMVEMS